MTRRLLISLWAFWMIAAAAPVAAQRVEIRNRSGSTTPGQGVWLSIDGTGCQVFEQRVMVERPNVAVILRSSVPCVDGKVEGTGRVEFLNDGIQVWENEATAATGITYRAGRLVATPDANRVRFEVRECRTSRQMNVIVPDSYALWSEALVDTLGEMGLVEANRICPSVSGAAASVAFMTTESEYAKFGKYGTAFASKLVRQVRNEQIVQIALTRAQVEKSSRMISRETQLRLDKQTADNATIERSRQAVRAEASRQRQDRRKQLAARHGSFELTTLEVVGPNPFVWVGKRIGVCLEIESMSGPSTALSLSRGGVFQVRNFPATRFPRLPTVAFLVAWVLGANSGVVQLAYVEAVDQSQTDNCSDYIDR